MVVLIFVSLGIIVGLPSATLLCLYMLNKPSIDLDRALKLEDVKRAQIQTRMIESEYYRKELEKGDE